MSMKLISIILSFQTYSLLIPLLSLHPLQILFLLVLYFLDCFCL